MNGSSVHPYLAAGSTPSSAPNQLSTSGPRAWWKPTTVTSGVKPGEEGVVGIVGVIGDKTLLNSTPLGGTLIFSVLMLSFPPRACWCAASPAEKNILQLKRRYGDAMRFRQGSVTDCS